MFAIALSIFGSQSIVGFSENSQVITDFGILWEAILTQVLQFFFHYLPISQKGGVFCLNAGLLRIAAAFAAGRNAGGPISGAWDVGDSTPATPSDDPMHSLLGLHVFDWRRRHKKGTLW